MDKKYYRLFERYFHLKERDKRFVPISVVIPNLITIIALCLGLSSIRFCILHEFELAVISILFSIVLDGMDGKIARLLRGTSQFGAQLDSLADIVNFGVCPALVCYFKSMTDLGNFGWGMVLLFVSSMALRLARFNANILTNIVCPGSSWRHKFSVGLPAPAAAYWILTPLIVEFTTHNTFEFYPVFIAGNIILASILMVSRIPTYLVNKIAIKTQLIIPVLLCIVTGVVLLISDRWLGLSLIAFIYVISIPIAIKKYWILKKQDQNNLKDTELWSELFISPESKD